MKQQVFISTRLLAEAVYKRFKYTNREKLYWLQICCWVRFLRNEPYNILYKTIMDENAKLKHCLKIGNIVL